jgi:hypothetical protein
MSSQSLMTPATFIVKALVLPMSRNTAMLRAAQGVTRVEKFSARIYVVTHYII